MNIANEGGFKVFNVDLTVPGDVDKAGTSVMKKLRNGQELLRLAKRKSIMSMAAPGLYMYPIVMSGGIDTPKQMEIAKGFQITYASSVATAYSLNNNMDRRETPQVSDFVQKFHQNDPKLINANLNAVSAALGIESTAMNAEDLEHLDYAVESATIMKNALTVENQFLLNLVAWDDVESGLVMESLNDIYKPYKRSERIINDKLDMIKEAKVANEAGFFDDDGIAGKINRVANGSPTKNNATAVTFVTQTDKSRSSKKHYDKDGNLRDEDENTRSSIKKDIYKPNTFSKVERVQNMTNLEPTMVNVQVVAHGKGDVNGSGAPSIHNITLAIKAMPRIVNSSVMIASMIEACQNSHAIFKFLKWTKGEIKTLDTVLGISASKRKAIQKNAKNEVKFLEQSKKRKGKGLVGRFVRNEVLPTTTVVITTFEAEKIKEATGIDLNRYEMAVKLMNKYYLLGFCIYDTEQDTMKVLFDADSDWGFTSYQSMTNATSNAKDVLSQNEILRVFGRR